MALCRTDLAILRADPIHERELGKAQHAQSMAERAIREKFRLKIEAEEARHRAAIEALGERQNVAIDRTISARNRRLSTIRECSIKRLGLRYIDILDDEGLAQ
jgi:hypothetical protein